MSKKLTRDELLGSFALVLAAVLLLVGALSANTPGRLPALFKSLLSLLQP